MLPNLDTRNAAQPMPENLTVHVQSRQLELQYPGGQTLRIPFELLRVYSPSAEVQGHSPEQAVLQTGKRDVGIDSIATVGHYAVQPRFTDGHDSGIYTWQYLYQLGLQQDALWRQYLDRLADAGLDRDTPMPAKAGGCGSGGSGGCGSGGCGTGGCG